MANESRSAANAMGERDSEDTDAGVSTSHDPLTDDEEAAMPTEPACVQGEQIVMLGDSYVRWLSHDLAMDFQSVSGQEARVYAVPGTAIESGGFLGYIPDQFESALLEDDDIRVVVMTGGGDDILFPDLARFPASEHCNDTRAASEAPVCQEVIATAVERLSQLWARMTDAGVADIVYFFYPHIPQPTVVGGHTPNAMVDYALPLVRSACEKVATQGAGGSRCHFVDMIPVFEAHPQEELFVPGDIHPNAAGSRLMAEALWREMLAQCVGQPEGSRCCA